MGEPLPGIGDTLSTATPSELRQELEEAMRHPGADRARGERILISLDTMQRTRELYLRPVDEPFEPMLAAVFHAMIREVVTPPTRSPDTV